MDQDGNVKLMKNEELELGYRTSCLERLGLFTVRAAFKLTPGDPEVIRSQMEELARKRKEKQPLEYPSAGSTFKRPEGYFAGCRFKGIFRRRSRGLRETRRIRDQ